MRSLPSGTVTLLFTDIEGSTKLAQNYPDIWEKLRERHHAILESAVEEHRGYIFQIIGDACCVAFYTASDGLSAAVDAHHKLQREAWGEAPIKVRMGLLTGSAELTGRDYRGYLTLAKVQRVMSVACGGQVLLSNACAELAQNELPAGVTLLLLDGIHLRLAQQKSRLLGEANRRLELALSDLHQRVDRCEYDKADGIQMTLSALKVERDVLEKISTWPWKTETLRGFMSIIALPILLYLISRFLGRLVGL